MAKAGRAEVVMFVSLVSQNWLEFLNDATFFYYENIMYLIKNETGGKEKAEENKSLMISFLKGYHFKHFEVLKYLFPL